MGLPPADDRHAPVRAALARHLAAALEQGARPADALKSTFMVACASAPSISQDL